MNIGYFLFALGMLGMVLWSGILPSSAETGIAAPTCLVTPMGEIAMCD